MNVFKKTLVAAVASAFVVSGAGMAATPVLAQTEGTQDAAAAAAATVDANEHGTLTIHKKSSDTTGVANDGLEKEEGVPGTDLKGAVFKVERVRDIDLTTADGWLAAERLAKGGTDAVNDPTLKVDGGVELTTGENGQATFEKLPLGLYRVTETVAPEGHNRSAPFFVTVPMTNPQDRDKWMYNIHIYPKNQPFETEMTKTVVDANRLEAHDNSVTSVTAGGTEFTQGTDYTVAVQNDKGRLYVIFTEDGRAKLDALKGDARKVQVKLSMKVKETKSDETGPVDNSFTVIENPDGSPEDPDQPGTPPENPPEPGTKPKSYFGNVKIVKQDTAEKGLQGAVFDVYRCNEATGNDKQKDNLKGGPIRTGVTTAANGEARVNGLHVNDFVDGKEGTSNPTGYCLVETTAPEGHELQADAIYFVVNKGDTETVALTNVTVKDVQRNAGFELPLTGGNGIWLILAAGGLLVVIGGGYYYVSKRRENA